MICLALHKSRQCSGTDEARPGSPVQNQRAIDEYIIIGLNLQAMSIDVYV